MDGALDGTALQQFYGPLNRILLNGKLENLRVDPLNQKIIGQDDSHRRSRSKLISLDPIRSFTVFLMQPIARIKLT